MAKDDALKRLGGGRWETKDGRFQIEPQSGTWVIVDTTQTNEFGLPLVRGPFPSLTAAREAIETARIEGPLESPLAERIERSRSKAPPKPAEEAPSKGRAKATAAKPEPLPEPEPEPRPAPPPEPKWIRDLRPADRAKAHTLIERLAGLDVDDPVQVARDEVAKGLPAVTKAAIERQIRAALASTEDRDAAVRAAITVVTSGKDADLGVSWRLVDERGRPIAKLDLDE